MSAEEGEYQLLDDEDKPSPPPPGPTGPHPTGTSPASSHQVETGGEEGGSNTTTTTTTGNDKNTPAAKITLNVSVGLSGVFTFLVIMAVTGTLFVWFEAEFIRNNNPRNVYMNDHSSLSLSLALSVLGFALSVCPNFFIPETHSASLKRFFLFIIIVSIDSHLCMTRSLFKDWSLDQFNDDDQNELRTARAGSVLVLLATFPSFIIAFILPGVSGGKFDVETMKKGLLSIRGVVNLTTSFLIFLACCIMWSIDEPCQYTFNQGQYVYMRAASALLISILLITTTLSCDRGTQDILLFLLVQQLVTAVPLFPSDLTNGTQKNFKHIVRAENAFFFIATLIYVLGNLVDRIKVFFIQKRTGAIPPTPGSQQSRYYSIARSVIFTLLALTSAIMMWSWSTKDQTDATVASRQANYFATLAVIAVVLNLLSSIFDFSFLSMLSLILTLHLVPAIASYIASPGSFTNQVNVTSYFRAGAILQVFCLVCSQLMTLTTVPKKRIDEFLTNPSNDDVPRPGPSSTVVFFLWSLAACYTWQDSTSLYWLVPEAHFTLYPVIIILGGLDLFGRMNSDVQRVVSLQCAFMIVNPGLWPLSSLGGPTFGKVFVLLASLITLGLYSWWSPADILESFHQVAEGGFSLDVQIKGNETNNREEKEGERVSILSESSKSTGGTF